MIIAELLDYPGQEQTFEWLPGSTLPTAAELTARALAALAALAGVVRPLSAELAAACGAPGSAPLPQRFFHVQQTDLPAGVDVQPSATPVQRQTLPCLTSDALQDWVAQALSGLDCGPGQLPQWVTLRLDSTGARWADTPPDGPASSARALLDCGEGTPLVAPFWHAADGCWLAGPLPALPDRAPLTLEFSHTAGALRLVVAVHWSPWAADGPGAPRLREALDGLPALGWQREPTA